MNQTHFENSSKNIKNDTTKNKNKNEITLLR